MPSEDTETDIDREAELEQVETYDSHSNPYWNGVARAGGHDPETGSLHRARIENGRVVEIECGQRAESWAAFTADSTPQWDRRTCSKCGQVWRVPGVERADHWSWVNLTDAYAPADWAPKPATDGGVPDKTVYVSDPPTRILGNLLIEGPDGQCAYIYAGIEQRCPKDAVAHTYMDHGDKDVRVEMCADHAREDVPEPLTPEQQELVTDGGVPQHHVSTTTGGESDD